MESDKKYSIHLKDGSILQIEKNKLFICKTLLPMMENEDDEENIMIPHDINKNTFDKILVFLNYYIENPMNVIPKPIPNDSKMSNLVQPFYLEYIYGDNNDLSEDEERELEKLVDAANFLDNEPLLSLCCAKIAIMIKSADKEKLNKMFGTSSEEN